MSKRRYRRSIVVDGKVAAAEYIRMSTEMQNYSGQNQQIAIRDFAERHGYTVVQTYADEGKSGLQLKGRDALQNLLQDVQGDPPFSVILIYDISRWGRFQDADESAFYEFLCRRAGVKVIYCAEPFANDGSSVDAIFKTIKRAMAGEYSRELSEKIFNGQCRMTERGFRQGGAPGLGLRRMRINSEGEPQGLMFHGQHKSFKTDRTILVPGPDVEIKLVRRLFSMCADERMTPQAISDRLNAEGAPRGNGRPWTRAMVRGILVNEKYVGHNVYNRTSGRLGKRRTHSPQESLSRKDDAFVSIVPRDLFERTQAALVDLMRSPSDDVLLDMLRRLLQEHGYLSRAVIESTRRFTAAGLTQRFGSLFNAYAMVGYWPAHVERTVQIDAAVERVRIAVSTTVLTTLREVGLEGKWNQYTGVIALPDDLRLSMQFHRSYVTLDGKTAWNFWMGNKPLSDFVLFVRMTEDLSDALDFHLVPRLLLPPGRHRLLGRDAPFLQEFRFFDASRVVERLTALAHLGP